MNKYAIFQGKIGKYFWEYIDTKEALKAYPYIKPDRLPLLMNNAGGVMSNFNPADADENFIEIVEIEGECPLTREEMYPKNSDNFEYGWIDPLGNTYDTGLEGHHASARYLCEENGMSDYCPESRLEKAGWVKITGLYEHGGITKLVFSDKGTITKAQADTLHRLHLWNVDFTKLYLKESQDLW